MRIGIVVQARMGSSRLPGKVLKKVLDKPLLGYLIERLKKVELAHSIIIATTTEEEDSLIEKCAHAYGVSCFRGSRDNVLARYLDTATYYELDVIVRITGDCPLIDPVLVDQVIKKFLESFSSLDYVSNCTITRTFPRGMDTELVTVNALKRAEKLIENPIDYEHVTNFINRKPQLFKRAGVASLQDQSCYRLTVDTPEDFTLVQYVIERLYPFKGMFFSIQDILALLESEPHLALINREIEQKRDHL